MNPTQDAVYRIHQLQATRRGHAPLPYAEFQARLRCSYDTDLTGLFSHQSP